ncbi:6-phospho-beta-glucosidase [Lederbergia lenta]|uniref:6-phospho-beta-glucosidase n=1 Tax=Lederbergia lenta TaxID=1467 RepID=A0A2X4ZFA9_LEDLE|nr:6-phospho-beta-glucosidase [Lederbergia lenta]MCM3112200.1 6-phospho-beta-glucosidase [Lederbergia lenta]MEC2323367.1 6-phospho-beta-glucosidase [Lederbergia lenta]SQI63295.1 6-phospho-beta-glucosidase [Lederbergia lenta]
MSLKVTIIGGGSSYTPEIIEGFMNRYPSFPVTEIVLVDIEKGHNKLKIVTSLAKRMIQKSGLPIKLSYTLDRRKALENADFVATQIRVGGLDAREKDERISLSHGVIGQETNGAGGIFKALRTIPVMLDIAQDIHEICPNAWMINFTNPAGIVTEALLKYSPHKKVIGVCNIPFNMKNSVAEMMDCNVNDVEIEFIGMNHFVFGRSVYIQGEDRTAAVLEKMLQQNVDYSPANIVSIGWSETFIHALKMLPNPYHQYYFQKEETLEKDLTAFKENGTRSEVVKQVEMDLFEKYKDENLDVKPEELEKRGGAYYSDAACNLMDSIHNNKGDVQTVNTMNNGAIPDLPTNSVIEVNAVITKDGPKAIASGHLPLNIKGITIQMKAFEELVIEAAISGDYLKAYEAMVMNPLVQNEKKAKILLDELLEAHKDYLPQFQK